MDDFRKPRADIPILPPTAFYRKRVVYKPPKHRRGKKPKKKREGKVKWYDAPKFKDIKERDEKRKEVELKISKQKQAIAKEVREERREGRRLGQETERLDIQRDQLRADTEAQAETQRYRAQHQARLTQQEERQLLLEDRRDAERRQTMERLAQISAEGERRSGQNQLMMGTLLLKMRDRGNPIREEDIEPRTRAERERPRPARTPREEERFREVEEKATQTQVAQPVIGLGFRVARSYADVATELEQRELSGETPTPRPAELPLYETGFDVPPKPRGIEEAEEQVEAGLEQGLRVGQAQDLSQRKSAIKQAVKEGSPLPRGVPAERQGIRSPRVAPEQELEEETIGIPQSPADILRARLELGSPLTLSPTEEGRKDEPIGFAGKVQPRKRRGATLPPSAEPEPQPQPQPEPEPVAEPEPVSHYEALMALKQEGRKTNLHKGKGSGFQIPDEKGFVVEDKTGFTKKAHKGKFFEIMDLPADESKNIGLRDIEKSIAGGGEAGWGGIKHTKFEQGLQEGKLELHRTQDIRSGLFGEEEEEEEGID